MRKRVPPLIQYLTFLIGAVCAVAATLRAQHEEDGLARWIDGMALRMTAPSEGLSPPRSFRMTEHAHWAAAATTEGGVVSAHPQHSELFYGGPLLWRLSHEFDPINRVDHGRVGDESWDLGAGVLVQYSSDGGRFDPLRKSQGRADLDEPLRSRLTSFGYCLTGGLHLIHVLGLRERELTAERSKGTWFLRAYSDWDELEYSGTWDPEHGTGKVGLVRMVRASVPARVGYQWTFADWRWEPGLSGAVAGSVVGRDRAGNLDHERHLEFARSVEAATLQALSAAPIPGTKDLLLGDFDLQQRRDRRRGGDELYGWDGRQWLRVLDALREPESSGWVRVSGWGLALVVVVHVLWLRRSARGDQGTASLVHPPRP